MNRRKTFLHREAGEVGRAFAKTLWSEGATQARKHESLTACYESADCNHNLFDYLGSMSNYSEYELNLLSNIEEHGWQFTYVFDPDEIEQDFGYSVGFTKTLNAPEMIVFGLSQSLMHDMIWEVYRKIENGMTIVDGMRVDGLLEGFECVLRKARHNNLYTEYATSANWFWRDMGRPGQPEMYQIVWPGAQQGLFPWEEGCDQSVISVQPKLW